jgi:hypothetical protein
VIGVGICARWAKPLMVSQTTRNRGRTRDLYTSIGDGVLKVTRMKEEHGQRVPVRLVEYGQEVASARGR